MSLISDTIACESLQSWSSRDVSLNLEKAQDPVFRVLVSAFLSLSLGLGTRESRSWF